MTTTPQHALVWAEIPVTDMDAAIRFYGSVFDWEITVRDDGPNPMADFPTAAPDGVSAHLYPGTPATGATVHLATPGTVEEARSACEAAGGTVLSGIIEIPPGRFCYALDPDGNSIGLFEGRQPN